MFFSLTILLLRVVLILSPTRVPFTINPLRKEVLILIILVVLVVLVVLIKV